MGSVQYISVLGLQDGTTPSAAALKTIASVLILYYITSALYSLFLHPLHTYPGPKLSAISRIPYWIANARGDSVRFMTRLHKTYGPVVRFGPNDLSYADGRAWKDIYVVQKGKKENPKELTFYPASANGVPSLFTQNDPSRHAVMRRVFAPAFSEKSLKAQEPMFQRFTDLLIATCREKGDIDMTKTFNLLTFDIMGELAFGESLDLLKNNEYSWWAELVFSSVKVLPFVQIIEYYPFLKTIFNLIEPKSVAKLRRDHFHYTSSRVDKRLSKESDKHDIWNLLLESDILSTKEMHSNAELFMTAGTETSSSLLTGLTYYLHMNPKKMKLLVDEIRGRFKDNSEITFEALAKLPYLNACIKEGLRIRTPVPTGLPRVIAKGGNVVLGKWVPEGTCVIVNQNATFHLESNFKNPEMFVPERWLGDPEYKDDNRDAHQPFSLGTRNCLGMNMAWHEMRLILAKLLFHFDIETDVGPDWEEQGVYVIWDRKPLVCRMKPATSRA